MYSSVVVCDGKTSCTFLSRGAYEAVLGSHRVSLEGQGKQSQVWMGSSQDLGTEIMGDAAGQEAHLETSSSI